MIETERLVLRPHGLGDLDDLVAVGSDAAVTRFLERKLSGVNHQGFRDAGEM